jgi:hypothetical protein
LVGAWAYSSAQIAAQGSVVNFAYIVIPRSQLGQAGDSFMSHPTINVRVQTLLPNGNLGPLVVPDGPPLNEGLVSDRNLGNVAGGSTINTTLPAVANFTESTAWKPVLRWIQPPVSFFGIAAVRPWDRVRP